MDETFVIPVKLRWRSAMFTLREIFYNEKLGLCRRPSVGVQVGEKAVLHPKPWSGRSKVMLRGLKYRGMLAQLLATGWSYRHWFGLIDLEFDISPIRF